MGKVTSIFVHSERLVELLNRNVYHSPNREKKPVDKKGLSEEQKAKLKRAFSEGNPWR